jgi:hypothetical protein
MKTWTVTVEVTLQVRCETESTATDLGYEIVDDALTRLAADISTPADQRPRRFVANTTAVELAPAEPITAVDAYTARGGQA